MRLPASARFWSKVDKSGGPDACWEWKAGHGDNGYGQFCFRGKTVLAHRFAYEDANSTIPNGLCVCHRCDNRKCCNPAHLFLGTHQDNVRDRDTKGRQASGDRQGLRLHPERAARGERNGNSVNAKTRPRGERHGMAKLTPAQVEEIRDLYLSGKYTQRVLGEQFGVTRPMIGYIVRGKNWKTEEEK